MHKTLNEFILIELKKDRLSEQTQSEGKSKQLVFYITWNQDMDGVGLHPETYSNDKVQLSKAGHGLKSSQ